MSGADHRQRPRSKAPLKASSKPPSKEGIPPVPDARRLAVEALVRIERDGAYANILDAIEDVAEGKA